MKEGAHPSQATWKTLLQRVKIPKYLLQTTNNLFFQAGQLKISTFFFFFGIKGKSHFLMEHQGDLSQKIHPGQLRWHFQSTELQEIRRERSWNDADSFGRALDHRRLFPVTELFVTCSFPNFFGRSFSLQIRRKEKNFGKRRFGEGGGIFPPPRLSLLPKSLIPSFDLRLESRDFGGFSGENLASTKI